MTFLSKFISILLLTIATTTTTIQTTHAATATADQKKSSSSTGSATYDASASRRERNLDHWNAETLAAYLGLDPITAKPLPATSEKEGQMLDEYVGHDAAVMFYAQWCPNCHKIAPIWDAIGTLLKAGTKKSNLIMSLFDCEKDTTHMKLCSAAGVRHYPTLMFVGSGPIRDTDPITSAIVGKEKSAGPAGSTTLRRTVKFQGEMGYSESILDWIRTMQGLSTWHKLTESGALRFVRDGFFGLLFQKNKKKGMNADGDSLPVGVPPTFRAKQSSASGGASQTSAADMLQIKTLETKLQKVEDENKKMEKLATHASLLLDSVLFPERPTSEETAAATIAGKDAPSYRDAYTVLQDTNGWEAKATLNTNKTPAENVQGKTMDQINAEVLRTCTIELSLDYCTRVSTHVTNDFLNDLAAASGDDLDQYPSMLELEKQLVAKIETDEPFCAAFDSCLANDFADESCRPSECPFQQEVACRYVSSCFIDSVMDEYGVALGYIEEGNTLSSLADTLELRAAANAAAAGAGDGAGAGGSKGGWGFGS